MKTGGVIFGICILAGLAGAGGAFWQLCHKETVSETMASQEVVPAKSAKSVGKDKSFVITVQPQITFKQ